MYNNDLDRMVELVNALEFIVEHIQNNPVEYPDAIMGYNAVLVGITPYIEVDCPHCAESIIVETSNPVGGLDDALDVLIEAIKVLQLEVEVNITERQALDDTEEGETCEQGEDSQD